MTKGEGGREGRREGGEGGGGGRRGEGGGRGWDCHVPSKNNPQAL